MDRRTRRRVERAAKKTGGAETVRLVDGPMDGWLVTENAPALRPDWPEAPYWEGPWGHYGEVITGKHGERTATWIPDSA